MRGTLKALKGPLDFSMGTALGLSVKWSLALARMPWVIRCCSDIPHQHFHVMTMINITLLLHNQDGISNRFRFIV